MAGHPTVGTAFVLAREQMVPTTGAQTLIRLEELVGLIPVSVDLKDGQPVLATMQQPFPTFEAEFSDYQLIAEMVKSLGSNNKGSLVKATLDALKQLRSREDMRRVRQ